MSSSSYAPDHHAPASTATPSNNSFSSDDARQVRLSCPVCSASAGYFSLTGLAVHNRLVHVLKLKLLKPPDANGHSAVQTIYRMDGVFGCPGCDGFYHMDPFLVITHAISVHGYRYPVPPANSEQSASASTSIPSVPQKPLPTQINQNFPGGQLENLELSSQIESSAPMEASTSRMNGRNSPLDIDHQYQQQLSNHHQQYRQNLNSSLAQNPPINPVPKTLQASATTGNAQANQGSSTISSTRSPASTELIVLNSGSVATRESRKEVFPTNPAPMSVLPPVSDCSLVAPQFDSVMSTPVSQPHRSGFGIGWKHNSYTGQPSQSTLQRVNYPTQTNSNMSTSGTSETNNASSSMSHLLPSTNNRQSPTHMWPQQQKQQQQQQQRQSPHQSIHLPSQLQSLSQIQSSAQISSNTQSVIPLSEERVSPQTISQSNLNDYTDRSGSSAAPQSLSQHQAAAIYQSQRSSTPISQHSALLKGEEALRTRAQATSPLVRDEQRHMPARTVDPPNRPPVSPIPSQPNRPNSAMVNSLAMKNQTEEDYRRQMQGRHVLPPKPTLPPLGNSIKTSSSSPYLANSAPPPSSATFIQALKANPGPTNRSNESYVSDTSRKQEQGPLAPELRPVHLPAKPQIEAPNGIGNRSTMAEGQALSVVLGKRGREDGGSGKAPVVSRPRTSLSQGESSTDSRHNTTKTAHSLPFKPTSNHNSHSTLPSRPSSVTLPDVNPVSHHAQKQRIASEDRTPSISLVFLTLTRVLPVLYNDMHMPLHLFKQVPRLITLLRVYHYSLNHQIQEAILAEARGEMPEGWSQKERKKLWSLKEKCQFDPRFKRPGEYEIMFKYWHQMTLMLTQPHQVSAINDLMDAYFPHNDENIKARSVRYVLEQMWKQVVQFVQSYKGPPENLFFELHRAKITVPVSATNKYPATLTFPLWIQNSWTIVHWAQRVHEGWQTMRTLFPDKPTQPASLTQPPSSSSTSAEPSFPVPPGASTEPRPAVGQISSISMEETLRRTKIILGDLQMKQPVINNKSQAQTPTEQEREGRQGVV